MAGSPGQACSELSSLCINVILASGSFFKLYHYLILCSVHRSKLAAHEDVEDIGDIEDIGASRISLPVHKDQQKAKKRATTATKHTMYAQFVLPTKIMVDLHLCEYLSIYYVLWLCHVADI